MRLAILVHGTVAGVLLLGPCGDPGPSGPRSVRNAPEGAGGLAAAATVSMVDGYKYEPATVTIKRGETVKWVNRDSSQVHTVSFRRSPPVMYPGAEWAGTFDRTGSFPYVCTFHEPEGMKGAVVVK